LEAFDTLPFGLNPFFYPLMFLTCLTQCIDLRFVCVLFLSRLVDSRIEGLDLAGFVGQLRFLVSDLVFELSTVRL